MEAVGDEMRLTYKVVQSPCLFQIGSIEKILFEIEQRARV